MIVDVHCIIAGRGGVAFRHNSSRLRLKRNTQPSDWVSVMLNVTSARTASFQVDANTHAELQATSHCRAWGRTTCFSLAGSRHARCGHQGNHSVAAVRRALWMWLSRTVCQSLHTEVERCAITAEERAADACVRQERPGVLRRCNARKIHHVGTTNWRHLPGTLHSSHPTVIAGKYQAHARRGEQARKHRGHNGEVAVRRLDRWARPCSAGNQQSGSKSCCVASNTT